MAFHQPNQANAQQVGEAAALRHGNLSQKDKKTVDQIIHSGDNNPHKYGLNPFADATKSYDSNAQAALEQIKAKQRK